MRLLIIAAAVLIATVGQTHSLLAQPYPAKAIRIVVPYAAGGPVDLGATAREGPDAAVRVGTSTSADRVARTLSSGQAFHGERVVVFVAPGAGSAAFVAGRRIGGAVLRNRARRILRAAWRELADEVEDGYDVVVVARAAIVGARMQELVTEVAELLSRAQVIRT